MTCLSDLSTCTVFIPVHRAGHNAGDPTNGLITTSAPPEEMADAQPPTVVAAIPARGYLLSTTENPC